MKTTKLVKSKKQGLTEVVPFKAIEGLSEQRPALQEKRLFTEVRNSSVVLIRRQHVENILESRLTKTSGKEYKGETRIEHLFMIVPAPRSNTTFAQEEGEDLVDTKYGKLRVFFVKGITRSYMLHTKKYPYPKISQASVH